MKWTEIQICELLHCKETLKLQLNRQILFDLALILQKDAYSNTQFSFKLFFLHIFINCIENLEPKLLLRNSSEEFPWSLESISLSDSLEYFI